MKKIITYIDKDLNVAKKELDEILLLENSCWDYENSYEWIFGWSKLLKEFINIRREHSGSRSNWKNPVVISVTNHLGHAIDVKFPIFELLLELVVIKLDKEVFIGELTRVKPHYYSLEIDKIIFENDGNIRTIENNDNSEWEKNIFWMLKKGLLIKSKNFNRYVEVKGVKNEDLYYEIEMLKYGDFVLSPFSEKQRDVPFDLGAFGLSSKQNFNDNLPEFFSKVRITLIENLI